MKFKNFENIEYEVIYAKTPIRYGSPGLCYNPNSKNPSIIVHPSLKTRRQLNVLIEEVFHAHLFDMTEKKARKFAANLGKVIYSRVLNKKYF